MTRKNNDKPHRNRPNSGDRPRSAAKPASDRPRPPQPEPTDADRIAKVIARAGLTSRRDAEDWIVAGRVAVNGSVITSPALNVTAKDKITVDGEPLPQRERTRLFLYNKPRGLVTTNVDPEGRPTIFDRLPSHLPRLLTVGRLDIGTEGLLLLTNDGGLARVLELPDTGWLRRYRVRALGRVTQGDLDRLRDGITVEGIHYGPIEATLDREQGANVWLTFAIREGKNREVRNVLGQLGLQVNRLIRVSYGPFQVGELAEGEVEEVRTRVLREQLGERVAEQANADFSSPVVDRPRQESPRQHNPRMAPPPQRPPRRDDRRQKGDHARDQGERPGQPRSFGDDRDRPRGERGQPRGERNRDDRRPSRPAGDEGRRFTRDHSERPRRDDRERPRVERGREERRPSGRTGDDASRFKRDHGERPGRPRSFGDERERPRGERARDDKRPDDRRGASRGRDERADRPRSFGDERPRTGRNRDERRGGDDRPPKPEGRPRRGHAWRKDDAPLRRHYRGSFKDERGSFKDERGSFKDERGSFKDERGAGKDERRPNSDATTQKRAGLLTDRKGRHVLVERLGADKKPPADNPRGGRGHKGGKRPYRPDRSSGPRPSRPKY